MTTVKKNWSRFWRHALKPLKKTGVTTVKKTGAKSGKIPVFFGTFYCTAAAAASAPEQAALAPETGRAWLLLNLPAALAATASRL